ncbi:putative Glutaredoxin [Trypanosoma vivax]|uniref:Putative glutaredoxin n=1 Tax=Trypanosoma vivax (strain Y486) TaxID=1055687 RepID=G0UA18_TRYVY|nr:putative Glutaredoxin [Trypanosoma vivax]CCC52649.1 putative glutaredoxin [Trypanosoma vivax Y486]
MNSLAAIIGSARVVVLSWVTCPYCVRAEKLLKQLTDEVKVYYVDKMPEGEELRREVFREYHHETVPAIFINKNFVGGCSDLEDLQRDGKLAELLK